MIILSPYIMLKAQFKKFLKCKFNAGDSYGCYISLLVATMKIFLSYTPAAVGGILRYELDTESLLTPFFYQLGSIVLAVMVIIFATISIRLVINRLAKQGMNDDGSNDSSTSEQHEIVSIQITRDGVPI